MTEFTGFGYSGTVGTVRGEFGGSCDAAACKAVDEFGLLTDMGLQDELYSRLSRAQDAVREYNRRHAILTDRANAAEQLNDKLRIEIQVLKKARDMGAAEKAKDLEARAQAESLDAFLKKFEERLGRRNKAEAEKAARAEWEKFLKSGLPPWDRGFTWHYPSASFRWE